MPTITDARKAIYSQFLSNFTSPTDGMGAPLVPAANITRDNVKFDTPVGEHWIRFIVRHTGSQQASLGDVGLRKFDRTGLILAQCYAPENTGVLDIDRIVKAVMDALEGVSLQLNDIVITDTLPRETGPVEGWYLITVEASFRYTETK
jgi:hypothetical protein